MHCACAAAGLPTFLTKLLGCIHDLEVSRLAAKAVRSVRDKRARQLSCGNAAKDAPLP